ncbi:GNAT family N-acetyltransferase [Methylomonas sp. AM2-LC]|uniref:GNAT family N-acetyltransferase n=1 Tax=Methylomonas sp. AM2-LC TaxID=3153301 RepID=UPI00326769BF
MQILDLKDEPEHLPTLAEWHHQQWYALNPGDSIEKRIVYMQSYLSADFIPTTFIAKNEVLLGSAAIVANDMDTEMGLSPWLASVFVAPEYRNKGVGSRLVKHVALKAQQAGIDTLYLFTDRVGFYEKLGWQVFSQQVYYGHRVTVMIIELNKS